MVHTLVHVCAGVLCGGKVLCTLPIYCVFSIKEAMCNFLGYIPMILETRLSDWYPSILEEESCQNPALAKFPSISKKKLKQDYPVSSSCVCIDRYLGSGGVGKDMLEKIWTSQANVLNVAVMNILGQRISEFLFTFISKNLTGA